MVKDVTVSKGKTIAIELPCCTVPVLVVSVVLDPALVLCSAPPAGFVPVAVVISDPALVVIVVIVMLPSGVTKCTSFKNTRTRTTQPSFSSIFGLYWTVHS